jgi:transposase-like protein
MFAVHSDGAALCLSTDSGELHDAQSAGQRELRLLRQENQYLRQQRDILKKALGILSAEMPSNASR